jgi:hypothetical protein
MLVIGLLAGSIVFLFFAFIIYHSGILTMLARPGHKQQPIRLLTLVPLAITLLIFTPLFKDPEGKSVILLCTVQFVLCLVSFVGNYTFPSGKKALQIASLAFPLLAGVCFSAMPIIIGFVWLLGG